MATCMGNLCPHLDDKSGKCTFSGTCMVKKYNLSDEAIISFLQKSAPNVVAAAPVVAESEIVFNPFQRGNGCMLAGYTREEIFAHTR